jgi:hypothetical protein
MNKKLLIETNTFKPNPLQLTENVNKETGNLMVEGVLATAEVKNGNGRYYSKDYGNVKWISIMNLSKKDAQWEN